LPAKPEQVSIHTAFLGGGRRRKTANDFVGEAVHVAKAVKAQSVVWTREDDMRRFYRPMWYDRMVGGVDATGNPVAWTHDHWSIDPCRHHSRHSVADGIDSASVKGALYSRHPEPAGGFAHSEANYSGSVVALSRSLT
jgi:isoquinoline 1-oxidoreductase beta subunit